MLRVQLMGGLELEANGTAVEAPPGRPARALLVWLALHPGTHARSRVAAALWPDVLDESARLSLRTALTALRRALGEQAEAVTATREQIGLAPDVWIDVKEFDRWPPPVGLRTRSSFIAAISCPSSTTIGCSRLAISNGQRWPKRPHASPTPRRRAAISRRPSDAPAS